MLFTLCILFHNAIHFVYFVSLCYSLCVFCFIMLFTHYVTLCILFHNAIHFVYFVS